MNQNNDLERINIAIEIGVRGLWRFYDDGFTRWPVSKLIPLFSNLDIDCAKLQEKFDELQRQGFIKLNRTDANYLEVIHAP